MKNGISRRTLIRSVAAAGALAGGSRVVAQQAAGIRGFDHVALPMEHTDEMLAFYQGLGLPVTANANACSVYVGNQMINFHRPEHWQDKAFTLRAPAAKPPCGDLCFVWEGTPESLKAMLTELEQRSSKVRSNARAAARGLAPARTCEIRTATSWNS